MGPIKALLQKEVQVAKQKKKTTACQLGCPFAVSVLAATYIYLGSILNTTLQSLTKPPDVYITPNRTASISEWDRSFSSFSRNDVFVVHGNGSNATQAEEFASAYNKYFSPANRLKFTVHPLKDAYGDYTDTTLGVIQLPSECEFGQLGCIYRVMQKYQQFGTTTNLPILQQSNYLSLQFLVDLYYMAVSTAPAKIAEALELFSQVTIWGNSFPFALNLKAMMALVGAAYWSICFIPVVVVPAANMVVERRLKLVPMMEVMGLKARTYTLSQILTIVPMGVFTSFCILVTMLASQALAPEDAPKILMLSGAYTCTCTAFAFVLAAISASPTWVYVGGLALMYILPYSVSMFAFKWSTMGQYAVCTLGPNAYFYGLVTILGDSGMELGLAWYDCVLMCLVDAAAYLVLYWYLLQLAPTEEGAKQPFYFPLLPSYWAHQCRRSRNPDENIPLLKTTKNVNSGNDQTKIIQIEGLVKQYPGSENISVDHLQLSVSEGEIYALLGHNGAGKTTTISILTGLVSPSSYDLVSVCGFDIDSDMDNIRSTIGVCPQHNVLIDELTAAEHLRLFGGLKGLPDHVIEQRTQELLVMMQLDGATNVTKGFSGGQKRKLSIAIALISNPRVLFLDEPSSGMDPYSRRQLWEVLKNVKRSGKTIVLTTHFMEEADVLGDTIGIMSHGKMYCCGTPLMLKERYGVGYFLKFDSAANVDWPHELTRAVGETVRKHISTAQPCDAHYGVGSYLLPPDSVPQFPALLHDLDGLQQKHSKVIYSYGISMNSLEDVFVNISQKEEERELNELDRGNDVHAIAISSGIHPALSVEGEPSLLSQFLTLLYRRFLLFRRRPIEIALFGMILLLVFLPPFIAQSTDANPFNDTTKQAIINLAERNWTAAYINDAGESADGFLKALLSLNKNVTWKQFKDLDSTLPPIDFLNVNVQPPFPGGIWIKAMDLPNRKANITILQNFITQYSLAGTLLLSMVDNALLHAMRNDTAVFTFVPELVGLGNPDDNPISKQVKLTRSTKDTQEMRLYFLLIMGIIIGNTMMVFGEEVQKKVYAVMRTMGMSEVIYCFSMIVYDLLFTLIPIAGVLLMAIAIDARGLRGDAYILFIPSSLVLLFTLLCFHFIFSMHFAPQTTPFTLFFMTLGLHIAGMAMPGLLSIVPVDAVKKFSLFLTPHSAYLHTVSMYQSAYLNTLSPELTLNDLWLYQDEWGFRIFHYLLVVFGWGFIFPVALCAFLINVRDAPSKQPRANRQEPTSEDSDVSDERRLVEEGRASFPVAMYEAQKEYGIKFAVRNSSWAVRQGECFGLLGPNGAGKTTSIKLLMGDEFCTAGKVLLNGTDLSSVSRREMYTRSRLGVCLQDDALWDALTGREHVYIMLRMRYGGLVDSNTLDEIARSAVETVGLGSHMHKKSKAYSGGMKRKLCVAIAMFTGGRIIFLDEPSSGMDPFSRRTLWRIIHENLSDNRCVILTTHSMEEADTVCGRLGIQVKGSLKCLGSSTHLKEKFGGGYSLVAQLRSEEMTQGLLSVLQEEFPGAAIAESHQTQCLISLGKLTSLAPVFRIVEARKAEVGIESYAIQQTSSLEQIFLRFAAEQEEEKPTA